MRRQEPSAGGSEVGDVEPHQQVRERPRLRCLDGGPQVLDRRLAEPVLAPQPVEVERVEVADVGEQAHLDEQVDALLAQALDVHGAAGREVLDATGVTGGTVDVGAVVVTLALDPDERLATTWAVGREGPLGEALRPL